MVDAIQSFFGAGSFIPHGHCYLWKPFLVSLHVFSDGLIAIASYSIPLVLIAFARQRQDLPFRWIFLLFSAFIIACGTTHLLEIWTLWHPVYWFSGTIKADTLDEIQAMQPGFLQAAMHPDDFLQQQVNLTRWETVNDGVVGSKA